MTKTIKIKFLVLNQVYFDRCNSMYPYVTFIGRIPFEFLHQLFTFKRCERRKRGLNEVPLRKGLIEGYPTYKGTRNLFLLRLVFERYTRSANDLGGLPPFDTGRRGGGGIHERDRGLRVREEIIDRGTGGGNT